jgi:hypothetical protein
MNDAKLMSFFEHITNLNSYLYGSFWRESTILGQGVGERNALDKFHDDEVTTIRKIAGVKNHCRMPMPQPRHGASLS